jgi:hypothetical protein
MDDRCSCSTDVLRRPRNCCIWSGAAFSASCLRVIVPILPHPKQVMLTSGDAAMAALKECEAAVIAFVRSGKVEEARAVSYASPEGKAALRRMLAISEEAQSRDSARDGCYPDTELRLANSVSETFERYFERQDWLALGWAKTCRWRFPNLLMHVGLLHE